MKWNDSRLVPFVSGIILSLLKACYGIWSLSLTRSSNFFRTPTCDESLTVSDGNTFLVEALKNLSFSSHLNKTFILRIIKNVIGLLP